VSIGLGLRGHKFDYVVAGKPQQAKPAGSSSTEKQQQIQKHQQQPQDKLDKQQEVQLAQMSGVGSVVIGAAMASKTSVGAGGGEVSQ